MEHVWTAYAQEAKDFSYRRYMADVCRLIGENVAVLSRGSYVKSVWMDEKQKDDLPEDGDAIARDIIKRAGLKFGEGQDGPIQSVRENNA